jgi:transposase-like protein
MENYSEEAKISEIEFCPNCGSDDYDIIPIFETETQSRYKCNECGYEWVVGKLLLHRK